MSYGSEYLMLIWGRMEWITIYFQFIGGDGLHYDLKEDIYLVF